MFDCLSAMNLLASHTMPNLLLLFVVRALMWSIAPVSICAALGAKTGWMPSRRAQLSGATFGVLTGSVTTMLVAILMQAIINQTIVKLEDSQNDLLEIQIALIDEEKDRQVVLVAPTTFMQERILSQYSERIRTVWTNESNRDIDSLLILVQIKSKKNTSRRDSEAIPDTAQFSRPPLQVL